VATTRTYGDACGIPRALDRIGERWALMIVRELVLGPKRFTDLRTGLPLISPDVLAQRLKDLEVSGVLVKAKLPPPAASQVYELTPKGLALEPVLIALGRWGGSEAPPPTDEMDMSLDAHLLSLRTLFDPALVGDFATELDIHLGDERFRARVAGGELELERGEASDPDALVTTDHAPLLDLAHRRAELGAALAAGTIEITGDRPAVARFLGLFTLPEPAPV